MQAPASLGGGSQEEKYTLEVVVSISGSVRASQQALEERAFVLAGAIEASIRGWRAEPSPFGGIVSWALVARMVSSEGLSSAGDTREASVEMTVDVVARI